jgi:integrase
MQGTKDERSPGVWRLRVFIGRDPVTGNPRQLTRTFRGTKKQADTALAQFVTEVANGTVPITPSATLAEFLDRWLDQIRPYRSPSTIKGYRHKIERINKRLGGVRLDRLTAQQLNRAYRGWLDEGLHPSSVHHLHRVLSAALRQAVKWGLLVTPPTARATPPPRLHTPAEIPSPDVVQRLIITAEERSQPVLAGIVAVAATTGLRRGELAGLRWSDIDLEAGRMYVRQSLKNDIDGGWVVGPTKTHQIRRIALDEFTLAVLRRHRVRVEGWATDAGVDVADDGYTFTLDPSGREPIKPDGLSHSFAALCRAAGVLGMSLHTLRHFTASMLIASGRDVRTIAGRLGHSDATTTLRVYAHMVEGRDQDAADYLGSLLAPGLPSISTAVTTAVVCSDGSSPVD